MNKTEEFRDDFNNKPVAAEGWMYHGETGMQDLVVFLKSLNLKQYCRGEGDNFVSTWSTTIVSLDFSVRCNDDLVI